MMDFKPGEILIYRDRALKKSWRVIALHRHPNWPEYMVCYVFETPVADAEDLHTIMNVPAFCLYREGAGYPLTYSGSSSRAAP